MTARDFGPTEPVKTRGAGAAAGSRLYPDVSVPKNAGRWIASVQHHMATAGEHRSASAVDLMIAATAAHHGLTVLHDDADYRTVARHAPDFSEHNIRDVS